MTDETGQSHEFRERADDYSMCVCGVPAIGHDGVWADYCTEDCPDDCMADYQGEQ